MATRKCIHDRGENQTCTKCRNEETMAAAKATRGQSPADAAVEGSVTKVGEVLSGEMKLPLYCYPHKGENALCGIRDANNVRIASNLTLAQARFIVAAVNSHAALCAALEEMIGANPRYLGTIGAPGSPARLRQEEQDAAFFKAQAALQLAKVKA